MEEDNTQNQNIDAQQQGNVPAPKTKRFFSTGRVITVLILLLISTPFVVPKAWSSFADNLLDKGFQRGDYIANAETSFNRKSTVLAVIPSFLPRRGSCVDMSISLTCFIPSYDFLPITFSPSGNKVAYTIKTPDSYRLIVNDKEIERTENLRIHDIKFSPTGGHISYKIKWDTYVNGERSDLSFEDLLFSDNQEDIPVVEERDRINVPNRKEIEKKYEGRVSEFIFNDDHTSYAYKAVISKKIGEQKAVVVWNGVEGKIYRTINSLPVFLSNDIPAYLASNESGRLLVKGREEIKFTGMVRVSASPYANKRTYSLGEKIVFLNDISIKTNGEYNSFNHLMVDTEQLGDSFLTENRSRVSAARKDELFIGPDNKNIISTVSYETQDYVTQAQILLNGEIFVPRKFSSIGEPVFHPDGSMATILAYDSAINSEGKRDRYIVTLDPNNKTYKEEKILNNKDGNPIYPMNITYSPGGSKLVYSTESSPQYDSQYDYIVDGFELPQHERVSDVSFSEDGKLMGYGSVDGRILSWNVYDITGDIPVLVK